MTARPRKCLFVVVCLLIALTAQLAARSQGPGAPYGTRDPLTCAPIKTSTLDSGSAKKLFQCGAEVIDGFYIHLVTNLDMEMGAARQYNPSSDTYSGIDPRSVVYPIRGSFTLYQCSKVFNIDASHTNVGKNCAAYPKPKAEGMCYRTTFGDWNCKMFDRVTDVSTAKMNVPPPGQ